MSTTVARFSLVSLAAVWAVTLNAGCGPLTATGEPEAEDALGIGSDALATLEVDYATVPGLLETNSTGSNCAELNWLGVYNFEEYGDKFWLKDGEKDGQAIGVQWRLGDGSRRGLCINNGGYGNLRRCDKNFVEGKGLETRMGRCNSGCSNLSNWSSWSPWRSCRT